MLTGTYGKETPRFLSQSCDFLLVKNFQNFRKEERNLVRMCITHRDIRLTGRFAFRAFDAPCYNWPTCFAILMHFLTMEPVNPVKILLLLQAFVIVVTILTSSVVVIWYTYLFPVIQTFSTLWMAIHVVVAHWLLINIVFHYFKAVITSPGTPPQVRKSYLNICIIYLLPSFLLVLVKTYDLTCQIPQRQVCHTHTKKSFEQLLITV